MANQFYDLDQQPTDLGPQAPFLGDDSKLLIAAFILGALMMAWHGWIGVVSNVIWEESHFVISGAYPDWGYPDIPAGFPWLAWLITSVFGWSIVPLRLFALLIATLIPVAVWFMARPVTTQRNALFAAMIAMLMPPIGFNGTVFYPEGALQLMLALMLGCMLRAMQPEVSSEPRDRVSAKALWSQYKWWVLTGLCASAGLLIHFRFLVPGLAMLVFLLASPLGREQWKKPGLYVTAVLAVLGLVPSLIYNLTHHWPAIEFHVLNRPRFDPKLGRVFNFLLTQMGSASPVFFVAMICAAQAILRKKRDQMVALLAVQAVVIFGFYWFQGTINKKIMPHWPFMAFLPLLPCVPGVLIAFADSARTRAMRWLKVGIIALGPLLGLVAGFGATAYQWAYRHSAEIPPEWRVLNILKNEDWTVLEGDLAEATQRAAARFGGEPRIATDGHIAAVHIEFPGPRARRLYTLDSPYDVRLSRFVVARTDWGLDRAALIRDQAGKGVVLALTEPSYIYHEYTRAGGTGAEADTVGFYADLCRTFEDIEPFRVVTLMPGRSRLLMFTARVRPEPLDELPRAPCPLMPQVYIAQPAPGEVIETNSLESDINYFGMAADPLGIDRIEVLVDGVKVADARTHLHVEENPAPKVLDYDPDWPNVQYDFKLPVDRLPKGQHDLSVRAIRRDGSAVTSHPRIIYVQCSRNLLVGCK